MPKLFCFYRSSCVLILFVLVITGSYAHGSEEKVDSTAYITNSLWDNWYGQVGVDMSLQNPYGCIFAHVFPNGKSYGVEFDMCLPAGPCVSDDNVKYIVDIIMSAITL